MTAEYPKIQHLFCLKLGEIVWIILVIIISSLIFSQLQYHWVEESGSCSGEENQGTGPDKYASHFLMVESQTFIATLLQKDASNRKSLYGL